jgi:hypothetical protein
VEGDLAPAVAEERPEAVVAASWWDPAATETRAEASAETTQGPAPAGGSPAAVVEILDDDSPPPGWDQWVSFPMPSPESQEGALVSKVENGRDKSRTVLFSRFIPTVFVFTGKYGSGSGSGTGCTGSGSENRRSIVPSVSPVSRFRLG